MHPASEPSIFTAWFPSSSPPPALLRNPQPPPWLPAANLHEEILVGKERLRFAAEQLFTRRFVGSLDGVTVDDLVDEERRQKVQAVPPPRCPTAMLPLCLLPSCTAAPLPRCPAGPLDRSKTAAPSTLLARKMPLSATGGSATPRGIGGEVEAQDQQVQREGRGDAGDYE